MRWLAIAIAAALGAGGCTTQLEPTQADLRTDWEAGNVPPANYKADLLAYMRAYLNDPRNVRSAELSAPQQKVIAGNPAERYVSCVRYDARNSGGQYTGIKTGMAVFVSGKLDRFFDTPRDVREACKDASFEPFPELQRLTR